MKAARIIIALLGSFFLGVAHGQTDPYPEKPIRIIVPFGGGSGSDSTARYFAQRMAPTLGQPVIVENRPGADGSIGMMAAKSAPADGYTVVQGGISPSVVNAVLIRNLGYDPIEDFEPLLGYGRGMDVLVASPESNLKSVADLADRGQKAGRALTVGTYSTTLALSANYIGHLLGIKTANVPYKGQAVVMNDVIGNHLDFAMVDLGGASPLIRSGKLIALGVTGEARHPEFPDIPTIRESGKADYVQYSWNAMFVRKGTPEDAKKKLSDAIRKIMTDEVTIREFYKPKGTEGVPLPPEKMVEMQKEQMVFYRKLADMLPEYSRDAAELK